MKIGTYFRRRCRKLLTVRGGCYSECGVLMLIILIMTGLMLVRVDMIQLKPQEIPRPEGVQQKNTRDHEMIKEAPVIPKEDNGLHARRASCPEDVGDLASSCAHIMAADALDILTMDNYMVLVSTNTGVKWSSLLTHWGRDKMAAISQTTFSNAFSWMKM